MTKPASYRIVQRFFQAQFDVFDNYNVILEECRHDIENATDQGAHDLAKAIFKDLVSFEIEFGEFDTDLWNYVYDIVDSRDIINQRVIEEGLADHKEYFFRKIENCVSSLEDVVTEIKAAGYEWGDVDELLESVEKLFDASEEVIEVDPRQLDDPEFLKMMGKIPPQKTAPIEVVVTSSVIKRKPVSHGRSKLNSKIIYQAKATLKEILDDVSQDVLASNCDLRIKKCFERAVREISKQNDEFSPVSLGISISVLKSFSGSITEEFGEASAAYILATLVQCEGFLRNFESWNEYVRNSQIEGVEDSGDLIFLFQNIVHHKVFDVEIENATDELAEDKKQIGLGNRKFEYSIFQSISNVISVALRESLMYIAGILGKTVKYVASSVERTIGSVAMGWLLFNYNALVEIAARHDFFRWIKPVIELIKKYSSL